MNPIRKLLDNLKREQVACDTEILRTPTGERRNALTDVNIHLMAAIRTLKELPPDASG